MSGYQVVDQSAPYPWPLAQSWSASDTALIMIDMQRDFLEEDGYFGSLGENLDHVQRTVEPCRRLLDAVRRTGMLIVHTRESHRPDLSDLNATKRLKGERKGAAIGSEGPMGRLLVRGEYGCDFVDALAPHAGEVVLDKPGNSAFYATDLRQILSARGITRLLLAGVTTDVCVSSTLRDANDRGLDCLLLEDCCGAATPELHEAVLRSMEREGGIFGAYAHSDGLLRSLAQRSQATAASPETAS
ncbi:Nicotinamidase-related amidase [Halopseudomonas xinjiangensis]|uniref:Nicotinamidase-related amidase n=1 Tax=Halopseudomonas xinjiangensis TaxID=487184 RepID=A0A1H1PB78_9GAMM|nr:cysteine hydrolase [Halopseudomonas xinjiangensis]SDS08413.1 Nicotinamidase-related amidase [Halopseudomonas xinjiangensis]